MYHYVRNLKGSKYENLKALELYNFKRQIQFLKKNYSFFDPAQNIKNNLVKSYHKFWTQIIKTQNLSEIVFDFRISNFRL